jgi:hypothetical protein
MDLQKIRDELVEAVDRMSDVSSHGDSGLVDQIFDQVSAVIRQRFGLSRTEADLLLADARMEAVRDYYDDDTALFDRSDVVYEIGAALARLASKKRAAPKKRRAKPHRTGKATA